MGTDDWYTPPYIIDALGLTYDLDPCAPVGGVPWIPAAEHYTEAEDGLSRPWSGRVWLNPPYSDPAPWVVRLMDHGNGIAFIQSDTSTRLFQSAAEKADALCFVRGRVKFVQPGDDRGWTARFASLLVAVGEENAAALHRSNLGWCLK
jgi:phage N-6-adenine-methyltransferase